MAATSVNSVLIFTEIDDKNRKSLNNVPKKNDKSDLKWTIVWTNVVLLGILHLLALFSFTYVTVLQWRTFAFGFIYGYIGGLGITAGAHRLWSHRSYKARLPLRILLCYFNTMALQTPIYDWVRDHRVHHKFTETHADPHNAQRGFFFAHMGWLLIRKHRDVTEMGKQMDLSDLKEDAVVVFQKKYHIFIGPLLCFVVPSVIPWYFWGEDSTVAFFACVLRYVVSLHGTWAVNSFAHFYGSKPYDKNIKPTDNVIVSICAFGEGWHNYHHVFPWDYKTAELGQYMTNVSTAFIDLMAAIGWAYELKTVQPEMIQKRRMRTGEKPKWGWGDGFMEDEKRLLAE